MSDTPPCRVCGQRAPVIEYPTDAPHLTVCPDCCDTAVHPGGEAGHEWQYDPHERDRVCQRCGIPRACTNQAWGD